MVEPVLSLFFSNFSFDFHSSRGRAEAPAPRARFWERCERVLGGSALLLRLPEVAGRRRAKGAPAQSEWGGWVGGECSNFIFLPGPPRRAWATRRHLSGPAEGPGARGPARRGGSRAAAARAPLGPAWASREAAWRPGAAAPPGSRPTFKSKWLKPRALGGSPFLPRPVRRARPQEEREAPRCGDTPPAKA